MAQCEGMVHPREDSQQEAKQLVTLYHLLSAFLLLILRRPAHWMVLLTFRLGLSLVLRGTALEAPTQTCPEVCLG